MDLSSLASLPCPYSHHILLKAFSLLLFPVISQPFFSFGYIPLLVLSTHIFFSYSSSLFFSQIISPTLSTITNLSPPRFQFSSSYSSSSSNSLLFYLRSSSHYLFLLSLLNFPLLFTFYNFCSLYLFFPSLFPFPMFQSSFFSSSSFYLFLPSLVPLLNHFHFFTSFSSSSAHLFLLSSSPHIPLSLISHLPPSPTCTGASLASLTRLLITGIHASGRTIFQAFICRNYFRLYLYCYQHFVCLLACLHPRSGMCLFLMCLPVFVF